MTLTIFIQWSRDVHFESRVLVTLLHAYATTRDPRGKKKRKFFFLKKNNNNTGIFQKVENICI